MKKKFFILVYLGLLYCLYGNDIRSITIEHIGWGEGPKEKIILNNRLDGQLGDFSFSEKLPGGNETYFFENIRMNTLISFWYYYRLSENLFDEIIDIIYNNTVLFGEREWDNELNRYQFTDNGTYELYIENNNVKEHFYLIDRNSSLIFLRTIIDLIEQYGHYVGLIRKLKSLYGVYEYYR